jgi:hypothetical protein
MFPSDSKDAVWLSAYDQNQRQIFRTATPCAAHSGRTYQLFALPGGYLAVCENGMARFSFAGAREWTAPLPVSHRPDSIVSSGADLYFVYNTLSMPVRAESFRVLKIQLRQ